MSLQILVVGAERSEPRGTPASFTSALRSGFVTDVSERDDHCHRQGLVGWTTGPSAVRLTGRGVATLVELLPEKNPSL